MLLQIQFLPLFALSRSIPVSLAFLDLASLLGSFHYFYNLLVATNLELYIIFFFLLRTYSTQPDLFGPF
jgi:hypothetical protein